MRRLVRSEISLLLLALIPLACSAITLSVHQWKEFQNQRAHDTRTGVDKSQVDSLGLVAAAGCGLSLLCLFGATVRVRRSQWDEQQTRLLLEATLESIGDGVITTDANGLVTFLNPVAERLTGWKLAEARLQPIQSVFTILNCETRQQAENPVHKVLRLGCIQGLANHTVLVSRSGTERPYR